MEQIVLNETQRLSYNLVQKSLGRREVTDAYLVNLDGAGTVKVEPSVARAMLVDLGVLGD